MTWRTMAAFLDPSNPTAIDISNAIRFNGTQLGDVVSAAFPGTPAWRNTFAWITSWLFDLSQGVNDKAMRNRCSYQPHELTPHTLSADEGIDFLDHLWEIFTPKPGAAFIGIDKYLLREALSVEASNIIRASGTQQPTRQEIKQELEIAYQRIASAFPALQVSEGFIVKNVNRSDPPILTHARDRTATPSTPLPILARATLFLRLATGVTEKLLTDAGVSNPTQLDFWLQELAMERGFIGSSVSISGWSDLFEDVQIATEDLVHLCMENTGPLERTKMLSINGVQRACEAERIAFWGLAA
ncbi:hypothetical protein EGT07_26710 [Herbaspirillum sp. HC18]|nr:hypothetical protein EGT07_26710 [Herbaspirillum sp. HC18]